MIYWVINSNMDILLTQAMHIWLASKLKTHVFI
jgi:hypothetical protein